MRIAWKSIARAAITAVRMVLVASADMLGMLTWRGAALKIVFMLLISVEEI